jgi:NO-binding membrane sensor protein with MHYT domain
MSSSSSLVAQWNAGYIILSYAIACLGSMVALELMKQRTAAKGLRNGLLLLGGAISLGAIGIWSMHFIGQ